MLKISPLVSSGPGIVSSQSGSTAWDRNHYSVLHLSSLHLFLIYYLENSAWDTIRSIEVQAVFSGI